MKIDFRKIELKDIEGNSVFTDISKELGKLIYNSTQSLPAHIMSQDMYRYGEVEVDLECAEVIRQCTKQGFIALVQVAVNALLDQITE